MIIIKNHVLYINGYELSISSFGMLNRKLILQKQIKDEHQAYIIIDNYLKTFEEYERVPENQKLNEIKFQYLVKNEITGLWNCVGFNFASYEVES